MFPSCSKKPWRRWRSRRAASTSTRPSAAAVTRAPYSTASALAAAWSRWTATPPPKPPRTRSPRANPDSFSAARGFRNCPKSSTALALAQVDGVLLDLGISSPQIDDAARGFSFRHDGPLDMRMDPSRGESAAEFLARATVHELTEIIRDYGEERFAQSIARAVAAARAHQPIERTRQLATIVGEAIGARTRGDWGQDPATRTFQALRIFVNRELSEVTLALPRLVPLLASGGRLAVISFHSLEDRIVKRFFARASQPFAGDSRASRLGHPHRGAAGRPADARRKGAKARRRRNRTQPARPQRDPARGAAHRGPDACGLAARLR